MRKLPRSLICGVPILIVYCASSLLNPSFQLKQYLESNDIFVLPLALNQTFFGDVSAVIAGTFPTTEQPSSSFIQVSAKPQLVIHIGPPKTGTTTIQEALLGMTSALKDDHYIFFGGGKRSKMLETLLSPKCHHQLNNQRVEYDKHVQLKQNDSTSNATTADGSTSPEPSGTSSSLKEWLIDKVECWNQTFSELDLFRKNHTNILYSAEPISFRSHIRYNTLVDWLAMNASLNDWNVRFIVTYRRFPEWYLSSHQQINRWVPTKPKFLDWPGVRKGGYVDSFLPLPLRLGELPYLHATEFMEEVSTNPAARDLLDFQVFNIHDLQDRSLVTAFLCDMVPHAQSTCNASIVRDNDDSVETIVNPSQSVYYDVLTAAAYDSGYRTMAISQQRFVVVAMVQGYHERRLKKKPEDFPLKCPVRMELELFLNMSLSIEEQWLPDFYRRPGVVRQHKLNFWRAVVDQKFCWIDTNATLAIPQWERFFEKLNPTEDGPVESANTTANTSIHRTRY